MTRLPDSPSTTSLLDSHLAHDTNANWFRAPDIPIKKLNNAIGSYASEAPASSVLALGDGTVFGSAKEGIVVTGDTFFSGTSEGRFSVPLQNIEGAKKLSGWPGYGVALQCRDGSTHNLSAACFQDKQDGLIDFLNVVAALDTASDVGPEPLLARQGEPDAVVATLVEDTSLRTINAGLKRIGVCQHTGHNDVTALFEEAFRTDTEWPLLKGYCQYVGFNKREIDGVFLLTNRRLLLFSMEMGTKIVCVEITKRLLGGLPVPFLNPIVSFFLFSIPRTIYVALRGGKEKMISRALDLRDELLLSTKPPLRSVQEFDFAKLAQIVAQVDIGTGIWTGVLDRKFGVSFAPVTLAKTFSVPKDLILSESESLESLDRLLQAMDSTLSRLGLDYRLDTKARKLTILPAAAQRKAAA